MPINPIDVGTQTGNNVDNTVDNGFKNASKLAAKGTLDTVFEAQGFVTKTTMISGVQASVGKGTQDAITSAARTASS